MSIAKLKPRTHRDPFVADHDFGNFCLGSGGLSFILFALWLAPAVYADDHAVLGVVSADLVWNLVCICYRDIH